MEIIEKQVEKVKEVPADGYYGYGYGRRDINGKANAGLTLGIIGTALGAWALFGNRRSSGLLGLAGSGSGMGGSNININGLETGLGTANGITSPSAFQAWEKSCEDALALQGAIYTQALNYQNNRFADRQQVWWVIVLMNNYSLLKSISKTLKQQNNLDNKYSQYNNLHNIG